MKFPRKKRNQTEETPIRDFEFQKREKTQRENLFFFNFSARVPPGGQRTILTQRKWNMFHFYGRLIFHKLHVKMS